MAAVAGCLLAAVVLGRSLLSTSAPAPQTLSHADVVQLADQFVRGQLDEAQTRQVEAHIKVCPQCYHLLKDRQTYEEEQRQGAQLPAPQPEDPNLIARSH